MSESTKPTLKSGKAIRRKPSNKKTEIVDVDTKALDTAIFVETIEQWDSKWHRFIDKREWVWTQEEVKEG